MRYIYYIIIILLGLSAIIGYELRGKRYSPKDAALIINEKVITTGEFNKLFSSQPPHVLKEKEDFINSLITKELLIQESQKEGIDKEESFRRSIQNFYEQSLIKLLIDRKLASLNITIGEDKLNRYIAFLNKKLHVTIFGFGSIEEAQKSEYRDGDSKSIYLDDLSRDIRDQVISLKEGQMTEPIKIGEKYTVIRLDKLETIFSRMPSDVEKEKIKKMLIEEKKEKIINDWIAELRKKASIKILISSKN